MNKNLFPFDVLECQNCGWIILAKELNAMLYDFGCPECYNSFENFTLIPAELQEQ
jgi:protein-arginine kinase activator protein McsA